MTSANPPQPVASRIAALNLNAHPEGGFFREIHRSGHWVRSPVHGAPRAAFTQILYLLPGSEVSRLHRVVHEEMWQFHEGSPLVLFTAAPNGSRPSIRRLGDPATPCWQALVPAGWWQGAWCEGSFSLCGCTVAPGFEFSDFQLAKPEDDVVKSLDLDNAPWLRILPG